MQTDFPLIREPYADLGRQLGVDRDDVIHRIEQLKIRGIIRQISPVLDSRILGYQTTLVAMRVAKTKLGEAERLIGNHHGVSHGYERDHYFNLWFTLAIPPSADMTIELKRITSPIGADAAFSLPAVKVFKLKAYFNMGEDAQGIVAQPNDGLHPRLKFSPVDKRVINELQQDMPLTPMPFAAMAARLSMDMEYFLLQCQLLLQRGILRRFSAAINHRKAGFKANAMACWVASPAMVDTVGQRLASLQEVSHCYERKTNPLWPYNIFAMIHGHRKKSCNVIVDRLSYEYGLTDYVLLFSTKEFKKARTKYLV